MSKLLCIYHGGCDDGFGAAYVVRAAFGESNVEFYPGVYQQPPPDCAGRDVLFVDFSYTRAVIEEMRNKARSILIMDHHKTAMDDLLLITDSYVIGVKDALPVWTDYTAASFPQKHCPLGFIFDLNRSGTGLAWDVLFQGVKRPDFVRYIEDRDLWRKMLPGGDEFTIALRSYPQTFEQWDTLFTYLEMPAAKVRIQSSVSHLIQQGEHIQRYYRTQVEALKQQKYKGEFIKHDMGVAGQGYFVNAPYAFASEVAGEIAADGGFGASYFRRADGHWQYSLRSRRDFDVSQLALKFGGGGHPGAAGFSSPTPVHVRLRNIDDPV